MMGTTTVARRIALEAWKKDIEAIFVPEGGDGPQEWENDLNLQMEMEVLWVVEVMVAEEAAAAEKEGAVVDEGS